MKERIYTVNLKSEFLKAARWQKSQRAVYTVRAFLKKHTKVDEDKIKIGATINEKIWDRGNQHPPTKIRIKTIQTDEGLVKAEMFGTVFPEEILQDMKKKQKEKETKEKLEKIAKETEKPKEITKKEPKKEVKEEPVEKVEKEPKKEVKEEPKETVKKVEKSEHKKTEKTDKK